MSRNLKVMMAYRGSAYHGFQQQPNGITVQEVVQRCVGKVLNEPVTLQGCSRTDAGVHARQFCFSVQTHSRISEKGFVRGVNGELPPDIAILSCEEAPPDFHARFSCTGKEYLYLLHCSECPDPFLNGLALHYRRPFHTDLVARAARDFEGEHDFSAFCKNSEDITKPVRRIFHFVVESDSENVKMLVKGDGFLYNMVRIMVGTLLDINEGRLPESAIPRLLAEGHRTGAGRTAPAHGLYLNRVFYDTRES